MKSKKVFWGIILIAVASLMILDVFHIFDPLTEKIGKVSLVSLL